MVQNKEIHTYREGYVVYIESNTGNTYLVGRGRGDAIAVQVGVTNDFYYVLWNKILRTIKNRVKIL